MVNPTSLKTDENGKQPALQDAHQIDSQQLVNFGGTQSMTEEVMDKDGYKWWIERLRGFKIWPIVQLTTSVDLVL